MSNSDAPAAPVARFREYDDAEAFILHRADLLSMAARTKYERIASRSIETKTNIETKTKE